MNSFFEKYQSLVKIILILLIITLSLCSFSLISHTASIWGAILRDVWTTVIPFFFAFILAYVIHPLISKIETLYLPRAVSVTLFYCIIFGSLYLTLSWFLPTLTQQLMSLVSNLPVYTEQMQEQLTLLDEKFNLELNILFKQYYSTGLEYIGSAFQNIAKTLFSTIGLVIHSVLNIIIIPIALFYFLKDYEKVLRGFLKLFPKKNRPHVVSIAHLLDASLGSYVRGIVIIMGLLSIIATLLLMTIGVDYPLLFGVLMGITDFIPFIGPVIGALPVLLFALTQSFEKVIAVLVVIVAVQFIEGNILQPFIIGRTLEMHPLLVMVLMLLAGAMFGFWGLLFAIPCFLMMRTLIIYYITLKKQQREDLKKGVYFED